MSSAALAATEGAKKTQTMTAVAGRSSYVPEHALRSTADPGASAIALILQAVAESLQ